MTGAATLHLQQLGGSGDLEVSAEPLVEIPAKRDQYLNHDYCRNSRSHLKPKATSRSFSRRVRREHERIMLTRDGEPETVLISIEDLEGLEMTLEILRDSAAVFRIAESIAAIEGVTWASTWRRPRPTCGGGAWRVSERAASEDIRDSFSA